MLFLLAIHVVLVDATFLRLQNPTIDIQNISGSSIQLSCNFNTSMVNVTWFERQQSPLVKRIVNVVNNEDCNVKTELPSETVKCMCVENTRVVCKISDYNLRKRNDPWRCTVIQDKVSAHSNFVQASLPGMDITTSTVEIIKEVYGTTVIHERESREYQTLETTEIIAESFTTATIKTINSATTDDAFRNTRASNFNVVAILATSGSFILLLIGLILCIYRKKVKSYRSRKVGRDANTVTVIFNGGSVHLEHEHVAAGCAPMEQLPCGGIDEDDDDPLYSRAKRNDIRRHDDSVCGGNAHSATIDLDSSASNRYLNPACDIVDDPMYTIGSMDPLHKPGHENGSLSSSLNKYKSPDKTKKECESYPLNSIGNDDPLYSVVKKTKTPVLGNPINNTFYDNDGDPFINNLIRDNQSSACLQKGDMLQYIIMKNEDSHNAVANSDVTLYTTVNEIECMSSTDKMKYPHTLPLHKPDRAGISAGQAESLEDNKGKEDPVYSTVCKERKRGANNTDWSITEIRLYYARSKKTLPYMPTENQIR